MYNILYCLIRITIEPNREQMDIRETPYYKDNYIAHSDIDHVYYQDFLEYIKNR